MLIINYPRGRRIIITVNSMILFRCRDLTLLETYTTKTENDLELPDFLEIAKEVTSDPDYSMYNLSHHSRSN